MTTASRRNQLAICGGAPVRTAEWPKWPVSDANTRDAIVDVLNSDRWAISGNYNGTLTYGRQFEQAFAKMHGVQHCISVSHGSAALLAALHALRVRPGDEVLVPGLTWVACASSVLRAGAIPVLIDIDPSTLCMDAALARDAITDRTSAIMLVHATCKVADLDAFTQLSKESGVPLIEDCSQAHGALWRDQRVGTFGAIGAFSMQNSKVLTCGEGGAAITDRTDLAVALEQLRSDGRMYITDKPAAIGNLELEEVDGIQGYNMCLSEFQSAVLADRLRHLDIENERRRLNARALDDVLANIEGVSPIYHDYANETPTYYGYSVRLDLDEYACTSIEPFRAALAAELNLAVELLEPPMNIHRLYRPLQSEWKHLNPDAEQRLSPDRFRLPSSVEAAKHFIFIPHQALLGDVDDMGQITEAIVKVSGNLSSLADSSQSA